MTGIHVAATLRRHEKQTREIPKSSMDSPTKERRRGPGCSSVRASVRFSRNASMLARKQLQAVGNRYRERSKECFGKQTKAGDEGCCITPSGRNRTSDQLISENTHTQYSTLQSIALPTELHTVIRLLPQQTHTTTCTSFHTHSDALYLTQHIMPTMPHCFTTTSTS